MADEKDPKAASASSEPESQEEMTTLHERAIATMSYIGFLAIVPFYLKKESKFCRFHGKQGLLIAILFFFAKPIMILNFFNDLLLAAQFGIFLYMGLATLSGRWKKFPWIYKTACALEDQLVLKTKAEEENEEAEMRPDEVQPDSPAESKEAK
jgi:uncharacterized membrane protein